MIPAVEPPTICPDEVIESVTMTPMYSGSGEPPRWTAAADQSLPHAGVLGFLAKPRKLKQQNLR